jgi:hypothetical protein
MIASSLMSANVLEEIIASIYQVATPFITPKPPSWCGTYIGKMFQCSAYLFPMILHCNMRKLIKIYINMIFRETMRDSKRTCQRK